MVAGSVLLLLLHAGGTSLSDDAPRDAHLLDETKELAGYQKLSRNEQRVQYRALQDERPGLTLPIIGISSGASGAIACAVIFWSMFTTPFGIAIYSTVVLAVAVIVSLGVIAASIALMVRNKPERDAAGVKLEELERDYQEGRCRNEPGARPCNRDPSGPPPPAPSQSPSQERPPPSQPPGYFVPQVSGPMPEPSLVLARF